MSNIRSSAAFPAAMIGLAVLFGSCQATNCHRGGHGELSMSEGKGSRYLYEYYDPDSACCGYMDNAGNVVIHPQFDSGQQIFDGLGLVRIKGKLRYIDRSGKPLIFLADINDPAESEEAEQVDAPKLPRFPAEPFRTNGKGEILIENDYFFNVGYNFASNGGLAYISDAKHWAFIDASGKMAIGPFSKDDVLLTSHFGFCEGLIKVVKDFNIDLDDEGIPAYIDKEGKFVIECDVEENGDFQDGLAVIRKNNLYGYIDKQGRIAIEPKYGYASSFWKGTAVVGVRVFPPPIYILESGFPLDRNRGSEQDFATIDKRGRILRTLRRIPSGWEIQGDFSEGLSAVKVPTEYGFDRYGFIDTNLNLAIGPEFDSCGSEFGFVGGLVYAGNLDAGLAGLINQEGDWVRSWGVGRSLTFIFRDTSAQEMAQTLDSFGAVPLGGRYVFLFPDPVKMDDQASRTWVHPNGEKELLTIGLEDNMHSLAQGMIIKTYCEWCQFEDVLFGKDKARVPGFQSSVALYVRAGYGPDAEQDLMEFALFVLKAHPGGVCDWDHNQTWTLEEVRANSNSKGLPFIRRLEKPTSPTHKR